MTTSTQKQEAKARLSAAAPELLETLEWVHAYLTTSAGVPAGFAWSRGPQEVINRCIAAIDKARGNS